MTEMKDILPVEDFILADPFAGLARFLAFAAAGLAVLFVGLVFYGLWRWLSRGRRVPKPDELALQELSALALTHLADEKIRPGFYSKLSEILRHYIEHHLKINFIDKTEEEILAHREWLDPLGMEEREWEQMKAFWLRGQEVKFAASSVSEEATREDLNFVRSFVATTRGLQKYA
jgi:hypothetical protein